ncbi:hypothetical protein EV129_117109 [Rhizobium azibense]|uniref:GAF domain-containing protein n=2 Tax=Rhizobium azibense TaxID=1136135 RepID=A0A4R3RHY7_9HYPH|nr:hypothetical protein EV129_117109 [Rhizobium azibense]
MIDLLRLRISHFRQDRILSELFDDSGALIEKIREIKTVHEDKGEKETFQKFEELEVSLPTQFNEVKKRLTARLRRDTDVILRLKVKKLSDLFDGDIRISFQNRILVYFLYKCGGFIPSTLPETILAKQHSIPSDRIIKRHGTNRDVQLKNVLSNGLFSVLESRSREKFRQTDRQRWTGGYFGFTGPANAAQGAGDGVRDTWRKEYLPGATALVAATFCSAVAAFLKTLHPENVRLRVTFHRAVSFGAEEVLQQCCKYFGINASSSTGSSAGRTFPAENATIGLAYRCQKMIQSKRNADPKELELAMQALNLSQAARKMSQQVKFVAAIPVIAANEAPGRNPVIGLLYFDSEADDFYLDDQALTVVLEMTQSFAANLERDAMADIERIANREVARTGCKWRTAQELPQNVEGVLEVVDKVALPQTTKAFQFNLEYSDFIPVAQNL